MSFILNNAQITLVPRATIGLWSTVIPEIPQKHHTYVQTSEVSAPVSNHMSSDISSWSPAPESFQPSRGTEQNHSGFCCKIGEKAISPLTCRILLEGPRALLLGPQSKPDCLFLVLLFSFILRQIFKAIQKTKPVERYGYALV